MEGWRGSQSETEREGGQRRKREKEMPQQPSVANRQNGDSGGYAARPSKGPFHFILLGHIHIKASLSVWECVGERSVCVEVHRNSYLLAACV